MTHEERLIQTARRATEIKESLQILSDAGISTDELYKEFVRLKEQFDEYVPAEYPTAFRLRSTPIPVSEHLTENRDLVPSNLHHPTSIGRIYTLTPSQREVLRTRYGMTPTKEVKLLDLNVWPAAKDCVRSLTLRSTEHVPENRKHVLNSCIIEDWVTFMRAAEQVEANAQITAEKDRLSARLDALFDRADKMKVSYKVKKGQILFKWLAEYDRLSTEPNGQTLVREALREILQTHGENELAKLVKEPSFMSEEKKVRAGDEKFADLLSQYL